MDSSSSSSTGSLARILSVEVNYIEDKFLRCISTSFNPTDYVQVSRQWALDLFPTVRRMDGTPMPTLETVFSREDLFKLKAKAEKNISYQYTPSKIYAITRNRPDGIHTHCRGLIVDLTNRDQIRVRTAEVDGDVLCSERNIVNPNKKLRVGGVVIMEMTHSEVGEDSNREPIDYGLDGGGSGDGRNGRRRMTDVKLFVCDETDCDPGFPYVRNLTGKLVPSRKHAEDDSYNIRFESDAKKLGDILPDNNELPLLARTRRVQGVPVSAYRDQYVKCSVAAMVPILGDQSNYEVIEIDRSTEHRAVGDKEAIPSWQISDGANRFSAIGSGRADVEMQASKHYHRELDNELPEAFVFLFDRASGEKWREMMKEYPTLVSILYAKSEMAKIVEKMKEKEARFE